jgi:hypothetical protein
MEIVIPIPTIFFYILRRNAAPGSDAARALEAAAGGASSIAFTVRCTRPTAMELQSLASRHCPKALAIIMSALLSA